MDRASRFLTVTMPAIGRSGSSVEAALRKAGDRYRADRTCAQTLAVSAWVALAEGNRDRAVALMRQAADGEDGSLKLPAASFFFRNSVNPRLARSGSLPARAAHGRVGVFICPFPISY